MDATLERLDKDTALPLYRQIKRDIRTRIKCGQWQPGERVPSENSLVESLGVSRMTVHRALRELTQEGVLDRVHGLGTFVAPPTRHASLITLEDIAREIRAAGSEHSCRVLSLKRLSASAERAMQMEVTRGATLYHLRAVHSQDGVPIQLEDRLVSPDLVPGFIDQDFRAGTPTAYLVEQITPDEMEHVVRAILPDERSARSLGMTPASPCLELRRRTWKDGRVVTSATLTYPGDRHALAARYRTDQFTIRES